MKRTKPRMVRAAMRVAYMRPLRPSQKEGPLIDILRIDEALERWHRAVSNFGRRK